MNDDLPKSLLEAVRYFSDLEVCHAYMRKLKWPDGKVCCPKCGNESVKELASRSGTLKCNRKSCQKQFSYKVGTIFESSPLGLHKWFVAVWAVANCKNGISSHELARAIGVTQKSAWFMLHRIREAMDTDSFQKFDGTCEADETFVGGKAANMHKSRREKVVTGRGPTHMQAVQGVMQRTEGEQHSQVRTFTIGGPESASLRSNVHRNVQPGSKVYTDAATGYSGLAARFVHATVDHIREYVRGEVHTNGLENFWCLFKRSIKGTWTHLAKFHVHRYAAEQSWRFNNRDSGDGQRFMRLLWGVKNRRLTYRVLCAIDDAGFMGLS